MDRVARFCSVNRTCCNYRRQLKDDHSQDNVTGNIKEASAGLGYTGELYGTAWNMLVAYFARQLVVVTAQLRRIYAFLPMKVYDFAALVKYSRIVSNSVQFMMQMNFIGDLQSEEVLSSAT